MLILTRKTGEQILIENGTIQLEILDFDRYRNRVRLGFTAPPHISIDRAEIHAKKMLINPVEQQSC